jgi:4-hydroxy-tetrahydrodipicolinate reductase
MLIAIGSGLLEGAGSFLPAPLKGDPFMTIRVCVAGATGWVGRPLCAAIAAAPDLELVGAVSRSAKGRRVEDVLAIPGAEVSISGSVEEALAAPTDALVDFTHAAAVKANVLAALRRGVCVVIGSSGLTDADFEEIRQAALERQVGVVAAGNFAMTAVLLQSFACQAARYLTQWEIIDTAADIKQDAPSGTARELAYRLSEIRAPQVTVPPEATVGEPASRGVALNGSQVHSIRLPGYTIAVDIAFGADGERLTLRQEAGSSAAPYVQGTLLAIRKVGGVVGLVRGLDRILD